VWICEIFAKKCFFSHRNLDDFPQFRFLTKVPILAKNFIFDQKFRFWTKISIPFNFQFFYSKNIFLNPEMKSTPSITVHDPKLSHVFFLFCTFWVNFPKLSHFSIVFFLKKTVTIWGNGLYPRKCKNCLWKKKVTFGRKCFVLVRSWKYIETCY